MDCFRAHKEMMVHEVPMVSRALKVHKGNLDQLV